MFFGYLHAVEAGEQTRLSKTVNVIDILSYPVSTIGSTIAGPEEDIFEIKVPKGWKGLLNRLLQIQYFIRESLH